MSLLALSYCLAPRALNRLHESAPCRCCHCPEPLEELTYEPFGVLGTADGDPKLPQEGVWGQEAAKASVEDSKAIHWFDGMSEA